jgi:hypothetical protein
MREGRMSDEQRSILASGEKFATQEAKRATSTTIGIEGNKPEGGPAEATITLTTTHEGRKVSWSAAAWFRRKAEHHGSSVGGKGEIRF